ncbi:YlcI/YnfO family protein [Tumidithrix elongata RA019]|uniref:YlcI/YnfO family protein n=1 Tax=Tumidithrix elongata BACA0141 TaxID=2716417 RepID=A0AAW9PY06_9CYAN|nr:YlcI/YnfO family protein [Tumidithrix elongata RA019]
MSRLTLRLPETLHQKLVHLAESEGVSLNQYIVYALTRQITSAYTVLTVPEAEVSQQKQNFNTLLRELGQASSTEVADTLRDRVIVQPESELTPEIVARLQQRIQNATKA